MWKTCRNFVVIWWRYALEDLQSVRCKWLYLLYELKFVGFWSMCAISRHCLATPGFCSTRQYFCSPLSWESLVLILFSILQCQLISEVTVKFHSWWFLHFVASNIRALSCEQTNPRSKCFYFVSMLGLFCFSLVPTHLLSEIGCWDFIQVLYCCYMPSLRNWRVWWSLESYCHPLIFARCLHDVSPLSSCNIHSPKSHSWL